MGTTSDAWSTLGEPDPASGSAKLIHASGVSAAQVRYARYEAGAVVPRHRHQCGTLVYGVGGPCIEQTDKEASIKRRLCYHPPGYEHALRYCGPTHVMAIEISEEEMRRREACWPKASIALPAVFYDHVWNMILAIQDRLGDDIVNQRIRYLLDRVQDFTGKSPPTWLLDVVSCIHREWETIPCLRELADRFAISQQHLCASFKRYTGVTIRQYGALLRLDYARCMLWTGRVSIAEVAAATSFADQSHLTRVLAARNGWTPAKLRRLGSSPSPQALLSEWAN